MKIFQQISVAVFYTSILQLAYALFILVHKNIGIEAAIFSYLCATFAITFVFINLTNLIIRKLYDDQLANINRNLNQAAYYKNKMTSWQRSQWNKAGSPLDLESLKKFSEMKKR